MEQWSGWDAGRVLLLVSAVMYLGIWLQVALYHRAGGFYNKAMYGPVIITPLIAGGEVAGAANRAGWWGWIAAALIAIGILEGLYGSYRHLKGIKSQIGGFSMRNLMAGPPPVLPLAYSLIGVVGLIALVWGAGIYG